MGLLFKPKKNYASAGSKGTESGRAAQGKKPDMEIRQREKISSFRKALLEKENFKSEEDYLGFFLKKWSMKPAEDENILKEILQRKDVNKNISWLASIRRDLAGMRDVSVYMESINDVARAVAAEANKKHINIGDLASYIGIYVLNTLDKGI